MKNKGDEGRNEVRVELKYCERCGMLWMRECGSGVVFCNACQPDVTELPILKKRPHTVKLGVGQRAVEGFDFDASVDEISRKRGGAA
jgi:hypothetical protein